MGIFGTGHSRISRRSALALAGGAAAGAALPIGARTRPARAADASGHQVFFGWVLGSTNIIAVALDLAEADADGARVVKAYVCDGLGAPDGIALWFKGSVKAGEELILTPPKGDEQLLIDAALPTAVTGAFTDKTGTTLRFASFRAIDGAGIYDVTLDDDFNYSGTSTDGSVLAAKAADGGKVTGTLTTTGGDVIDFSVNVLAVASEESLKTSGLPVAFRDFADVSIIPDSYVAVISPAGAFWLGRSGDIRGGSAGNNIIGLDMCEVVAR
jgi:hypothetical protein